MQAVGWRALSIANIKWLQKLSATKTCLRNQNCRIFVGRKGKSLRWAFSLFASLSEVIAGHYKGGCYPAQNICFSRINCSLESLTQPWFQFCNSILSLQALPIIPVSLEDVQNGLLVKAEYSMVKTGSNVRSYCWSPRVIWAYGLLS